MSGSTTHTTTTGTATRWTGTAAGVVQNVPFLGNTGNR